MGRIKKINYCLPGRLCPKRLGRGLLLIVFCLLLTAPAQSQTPAIDLTLTWSTDTYIPADYPGKALPSRGSIVEIVANVDSLAANPWELDYRWFLNSSLQKESSGPGKIIFRFMVRQQAANNQSVRVEARDNQGVILSSASSEIRIVDPEIVLLGPLSSLSLDEYQINSNQKVNFIAKPYFFNIDHLDDLDYSWHLADKEAAPESSDQPNILFLEIEEIDRAISQRLTILAKNRNNYLEQARNSAQINIIP